MTRTGTMVSCSLLAAFGAACERQVDTNYQGEPLVQIHGSLVIPQGLQSSSLVPAIAWFAHENPGADNHKLYMRISDVGVTGSFPGGFTLDVYDPAPSDALIRDIPGEPAYAEARVTAVSPSYPRTINMRSVPNGCGEYCFLNMICPGTEADYDPNAAHDECSQQHIDCRAQFESNDMVGELDLNTCAVRGVAGDPNLAFGGVSKNIYLAYFSAPVPADTLLAERFSNGAAIPAGYYVYRVDRIPPVVENAADYVPSEAEKCWAKAMEMALARFNTEHGTNYTKDEKWESAGGMRDEYFDYQRTFFKVRRELGCARPPSDVTALNVATDSIAIELGPQASGF